LKETAAPDVSADEKRISDLNWFDITGRFWFSDWSMCCFFLSHLKWTPQNQQQHKLIHSQQY
jgi:hypothetical protein